MKLQILILTLLVTFQVFSQTKEQLIKDNCECLKQISSDLNNDQKSKSLMDCSLNAFKKNRIYTEKVVKEFTGKNQIDGKDVFKYHQEVFDDIMMDNCDLYKEIMIEVLGIDKSNEVIQKIGSKVCKELDDNLNQEKIKITIDKITKDNLESITQKYKTDEKKYVDDLRFYLVNNCGKYRKYSLEYKE
ncbi:hypothetical protein GCM10009430_37790 [Aquimarina litoralis]|uniref:Uncharacterized protein n=1 Tax=Aquimarina litoralis TaxID=584605 RepID=A0ABN1J4K0_9FLAO